MGSAKASLKILVVENENLLRHSIVDMLQDMGHDPLEAVSGNSALKLLAAGEPVDVMLIDIGLPDMDGRELAAHAQHMRPKLPMVFATGHDSSWIRGIEKTISAGYLPKPYRQHDLERVLDRLGCP